MLYFETLVTGQRNDATSSLWPVGTQIQDGKPWQITWVPPKSNNLLSKRNPQCVCVYIYIYDNHTNNDNNNNRVVIIIITIICICNVYIYIYIYTQICIYIYTHISCTELKYPGFTIDAQSGSADAAFSGNVCFVQLIEFSLELISSHQHCRSHPQTLVSVDTFFYNLAAPRPSFNIWPVGTNSWNIQMQWSGWFIGVVISFE